jgi:hypothetical protein
MEACGRFAFRVPNRTFEKPHVAFLSVSAVPALLGAEIAGWMIIA